MAVKDPEDLADELRRSESTLREALAQLGRLRQSIGASDLTLTTEDIAERLGISSEALRAFAESATEALGGHTLTVQAARRAGVLAVAGQVWEGELGPLLTSAQVRALLGSASQTLSRQRVDELLRARRLIGLLDGGGRRRFPAFQFEDVRPLESLIDAYWTVAGGVASEWTAAAWCVAPDDALDGMSPLAWARNGADPGVLARVARQQGARLAQ